MNNNATWFEIFVYLGIGVVLFAFVAILLAFTNPKIEAQCAAKGGQVFARPGEVSSCIYPAK